MRMYIDDRWVDASDGATRMVRNPADASLLDTVPEATQDDAARAVEAAVVARAAMAALPAHARHAALAQVAGRIEQDAETLARLLARENGKTLRETRQEVAAAVRIFRGYGEEAKRRFGRVTPLDAVPGLEDGIALTQHVPVGVVAAIVPFNYPVELWAHKCAGGLAAGNAVITKPPEECPLTLLTITGFLAQAGLPRGAHQALTGAGETVGAFLARAPGVNLVAMTGSTEAGRQIAAAASATLKKVHLELGGNDATIVCADADVAGVADRLVDGRFRHGNGQICCAVKRVLVDRRVHDALLDALVRRTAALRVGDPLDESTDVGPLITEHAARRVRAQIDEGVAAGARLEIGGERAGSFVSPAVLSAVTAENPAFRQEVFGPVLPLIAFDDVEQAFALANDSPWGLQAALFTRDLPTVMAAWRCLDVGTVVVGHTTAIRVESLPFGGTKASGNAREGVHDLLACMTEARTLLLPRAWATSAQAAA